MLAALFHTDASSLSSSGCSSLSTDPGPGAITARAIEALGELVLNNVNFLVARRKLAGARKILSNLYRLPTGGEHRELEHACQDITKILSIRANYPLFLRRTALKILVALAHTDEGRATILQSGAISTLCRMIMRADLEDHCLKAVSTLLLLTAHNGLTGGTNGSPPSEGSPRMRVCQVLARTYWTESEFGPEGARTDFFAMLEVCFTCGGFDKSSSGPSALLGLLGMLLKGESCVALSAADIIDHLREGREFLLSVAQHDMANLIRRVDSADKEFMIRTLVEFLSSGHDRQHVAADCLASLVHIDVVRAITLEEPSLVALSRMLQCPYLHAQRSSASLISALIRYGGLSAIRPSLSDVPPDNTRSAIIHSPLVKTSSALLISPFASDQEVGVQILSQLARCDESLIALADREFVTTLVNVLKGHPQSGIRVSTARFALKTIQRLLSIDEIALLIMQIDVLESCSAIDLSGVTDDRSLLDNVIEELHSRVQKDAQPVFAGSLLPQVGLLRSGALRGRVRPKTWTE